MRPNCVATCDLAAVGPGPLLDNKAPVLQVHGRLSLSCGCVRPLRPASNYARKVGAMVPRAGTLMDDWVAMRATTDTCMGVRPPSELAEDVQV